ncbi:PREDICTED: B-cell lymphoma 3 protein [Gekko japonicus]|uniref:B-cell lymphoma 3 protein n=1 Tax=Gekko japonicus TaxID=146911 RepID=A0ABM1L5X4_GEKJA|nr:PREDICTED: B-cell lymphoma 3 protein [Gekko japonicus]
MAGELPVDLRTWRKGEDRGSGVPSDGAGAVSPDGGGRQPSEAEVSLGSGGPQTLGQKPAGEPEGAQAPLPYLAPGPLLPGVRSAASPQAGLEGEKMAETCLPLRKRRYAVQGGNGEAQGPLAGKVPKTENGEGAMDAWGPPCNGYCPSYVPVRLPAAYYPGLPASFLTPEMTPVLHPMAHHHLLGVPTPYSLLYPLQTQLALDIATATKQDEDGDTPLHIAVVQENLSVARRLVGLFQKGQRDLDAFNNLRQTPLHLAVITGQPALVKLLLSHGASPMVLDRNGQTALHLACEHGSLRCLQEMLEGRPSPLDLEARNFEGFTPLHVAVATSNHDVILTLLEHGADVDAVDIKSGRSPLLHAVENNNLEMVELLLQHGANVNAQSYGGNTALHAASGRGFLDALRLLVRNGADGSLKNYHNDTPLMVAKNKRVTDILRGKASRPDHVREGSSPATSTASSPGIRPAYPSLLRASPDSCPTTPSPARTPKPPRAVQSPTVPQQKADSMTSPNGTSAASPLRGVKLERSPTPPAAEQPAGFVSTPSFFLPLLEPMMDPAYHGALYPFPPSHHNHPVQLLPVSLNPSAVSLPRGSHVNQIHPRGMGLDQSLTLLGAENPPDADPKGQRIHGRDSGPGGS